MSTRRNVLHKIARGGRTKDAVNDNIGLLDLYATVYSFKPVPLNKLSDFTHRGGQKTPQTLDELLS